METNAHIHTCCVLVFVPSHTSTHIVNILHKWLYAWLQLVLLPPPSPHGLSFIYCACLFILIGISFEQEK